MNRSGSCRAGAEDSARARRTPALEAGDEERLELEFTSVSEIPLSETARAARDDFVTASQAIGAPVRNRHDRNEVGVGVLECAMGSETTSESAWFSGPSVCDPSANQSSTIASVPVAASISCAHVSKASVTQTARDATGDADRLRTGWGRQSRILPRR